MIYRIARSLTLEPRWAGNLKSEFYVSDHIIIGDQWLQLAGVDKLIRKAWFIHDFSETWLRDMPTPEKRNLPDYMAREAQIMNKMQDEFGVGDISMHHPAIKLCDRDMASAEDATVHFEPCGYNKGENIIDLVYGQPDSALVALIEQRPRISWSGRQAAFLALYGELWDA